MEVVGQPELKKDDETLDLKVRAIHPKLKPKNIKVAGAEQVGAEDRVATFRFPRRYVIGGRLLVNAQAGKVQFPPISVVVREPNVVRLATKYIYTTKEDGKYNFRLIVIGQENEDDPTMAFVTDGNDIPIEVTIKKNGKTLSCRCSVDHLPTREATIKVGSTEFGVIVRER